MSALLGLLIPLIIIVLPLLGLLCFGKMAYKKGNLIVAIILGIVMVAIGLVTPILATFISIKGLSLGQDHAGCVTGAATFIFFGYFATILTMMFAIFNGYRTFKRKKWLESSII